MTLPPERATRTTASATSSTLAAAALITLPEKPRIDPIYRSFAPERRQVQGEGEEAYARVCDRVFDDANDVFAAKPFGQLHFRRISALRPRSQRAAMLPRAR